MESTPAPSAFFGHQEPSAPASALFSRPAQAPRYAVVRSVGGDSSTAPPAVFFGSEGSGVGGCAPNMQASAIPVETRSAIVPEEVDQPSAFFGSADAGGGASSLARFGVPLRSAGASASAEGAHPHADDQAPVASSSVLFTHLDDGEGSGDYDEELSSGAESDRFGAETRASGLGSGGHDRASPICASGPRYPASEFHAPALPGGGGSDGSLIPTHTIYGGAEQEGAGAARAERTKLRLGRSGSARHSGRSRLNLRPDARALNSDGVMDFFAVQPMSARGNAPSDGWSLFAMPAPEETPSAAAESIVHGAEYSAFEQATDETGVQQGWRVEPPTAEFSTSPWQQAPAPPPWQQPRSNDSAIPPWEVGLAKSIELAQSVASPVPAKKKSLPPWMEGATDAISEPSERAGLNPDTNVLPPADSGTLAHSPALQTTRQVSSTATLGYDPSSMRAASTALGPSRPLIGGSHAFVPSESAFSEEFASGTNQKQSELQHQQATAGTLSSAVPSSFEPRQPGVSTGAGARPSTSTPYTSTALPTRANRQCWASFGFGGRLVAFSSSGPGACVQVFSVGRLLEHSQAPFHAAMVAFPGPLCAAPPTPRSALPGQRKLGGARPGAVRLASVDEVCGFLLVQQERDVVMNSATSASSDEAPGSLGRTRGGRARDLTLLYTVLRLLVVRGGSLYVPGGAAFIAGVAAELAAALTAGDRVRASAPASFAEAKPQTSGGPGSYEGSHSDFAEGSRSCVEKNSYQPVVTENADETAEDEAWEDNADIAPLAKRAQAVFAAAASEAGAFPSPTSDELMSAQRRVDDFLRCGDRSAAFDAALSARLWPQALLLGASLSKAAYSRAVASFTALAVPARSPARALFPAFAGDVGVLVRQPLSVDALSFARRAATTDHAHVPPAAEVDAREEVLQRAHFMRGWRRRLALLLLHRVPAACDPRALIVLGDRVWAEAGSALGAHALYLVAGIALEPPSLQARMAVVGADHRRRRLFFLRDVQALQRSEVLEFALRRGATGGGGGTCGAALPAAQPLKLLYAMALADSDWDLRARALEYAEAIRHSVAEAEAEAAAESAAVGSDVQQLNFNPMFLTEASAFEVRVRVSLGLSPPPPPLFQWAEPKPLSSHPQRDYSISAGTGNSDGSSRGALQTHEGGSDDQRMKFTAKSSAAALSPPDLASHARGVPAPSPAPATAPAPPPSPSPALSLSAKPNAPSSDGAQPSSVAGGGILSSLRGIFRRGDSGVGGAAALGGPRQAHLSSSKGAAGAQPYYDEALKRWVFPGDDIPAAPAAGPPPLASAAASTPSAKPPAAAAGGPGLLPDVLPAASGLLPSTAAVADTLAASSLRARGARSRYVDTLGGGGGGGANGGGSGSSGGGGGGSSGGGSPLKPPLPVGPAQTATPPASIASRPKVVVFTPPPAPPSVADELLSAPPFEGLGPAVAAEAREKEARAATAAPVADAAAAARACEATNQASPHQATSFAAASAAAAPPLTIASALPDLDF